MNRKYYTFQYFVQFGLVLLFSVLGFSVTKAQHTLQGVVTDAVTGQPVETATVQLLRGSAEKLVNYTFTDAKGVFAMTTGNLDSLQIAVSLLGYKPEKQGVIPDKINFFKLEEQAFSLREVEIRPGRVYGNRDTINYDVTQFLSAKDETIKDVIKKLPGVDVDDLGRITYNGKDISNFYVEGLDLTDGKYNQITNNLDAKSVETVQLLENHQPIRILQDKIKTDQVALNLKLKPEFRAKWMVTLQGAVGASPFIWDGWLNAMRLSRQSQSAYVYKGNNRGFDIADENIRFFNQQAGRLQEPDGLQFLSQPSIMAPLKKDRLLFNDIHSLSASRLYKLNETTRLRINADYSHDKREQNRGSETSYFQQDTMRLSEQSHTRILSDQAELTLNLENNSPERFLTNKLNATGDWLRSTSDFTGTESVHQRIKTPKLGLRNDFRNLWERNDYTYEVRSVLRYNHVPSTLSVNDKEQHLRMNHFYTDNSFSLLKKKGYLTRQYAAGIGGEINTIQNGYTIYIAPLWQWNKGKWQNYYSLPVKWTTYPGGDLSRLTATPSVSLSYKLNYAWRFFLSGSYREQYGNVTGFYASPYQTDYRHSVQNEGSLPIRRIQNYSLSGEYKNTISEFFATLSVSHNRSWASHIYEQVITDDRVTLQSHKQSNDAESWSVRGTLSKGFYDWGMKTSLDYRFSHSEGEQWSRGERMPYRSNTLQLEPKISWSPSKQLETGYEASLRRHESRIGNGTRLDPLWNIVQKLYLSYNVFPFEVNVSGDHYYNDINRNKSVSDFFADFSVRWEHVGWQLTASVTNLFDKRQYSYTEYSSIQSYTSWIDIRGREFLVSARYKF